MQNDHHLGELPPLIEIVGKLRESSEALRSSINSLVAYSKTYGAKNHELLLSMARARHTAREELRLSTGKKDPTVKDIDDHLLVKFQQLAGEVSDAKVMRSAMKNAVDAHRSDISAWQSLARAYQAELDFVRKGG